MLSCNRGPTPLQVLVLLLSAHPVSSAGDLAVSSSVPTNLLIRRKAKEAPRAPFLSQKRRARNKDGGKYRISSQLFSFLRSNSFFGQYKCMV